MREQEFEKMVTRSYQGLSGVAGKLKSRTVQGKDLLTADGRDRRGFEGLRVNRGPGLGCVVVFIVCEDWQNGHLLWG